MQERYHRHYILPQVGREGQKKIQNSKVLIVGVGGLGCPVALELVAAGVGTIGLVDFDVVEESNLQRQILYTEQDVGKPKVEAAARHLRERNSQCKIYCINDKISFRNHKRRTSKIYFSSRFCGTDAKSNLSCSSASRLFRRVQSSYENCICFCLICWHH